MSEILKMAEVANLGEKIYEESLKQEYEGKYNDKFLAVDVTTRKGHLGEHPEIALEIAKKKNPDGQFFLKRIGAPATFHVSCIGGMDVDGLFQPA